MSEEENKANMRRFYEEVWGKGNLDVADELAAENFVDHNLVDPNLPPGIEGFKQIVPMFRTAFPDMQFTIEDLIAKDDKVVSRLTVRATHKGEFMGIPPTGKQATITGIDIFRIVDGKIVERWGEVDMFRLMQELGVVQTPEGE
ncbi:MAG: ester cyclase [Thermoplasmatales archaeon]|nr:MAG: ester cyclase [Thermoplasmatales archaeon]